MMRVVDQPEFFRSCRNEALVSRMEKDIMKDSRTIERLPEMPRHEPRQKITRLSQK